MKRDCHSHSEIGLDGIMVVKEDGRDSVTDFIPLNNKRRHHGLCPVRTRSPCCPLLLVLKTIPSPK